MRGKRVYLDEPRLLKLYLEDKLSVCEVGRKLGVNYQVVARRLKIRGIKIRTGIAWLKGKTMGKEYREKLRQAKLAKPVKYWLGKKRSLSTNDKISRTKRKSSKTIKGLNHPNWRGGISRGYKTGYYSTAYKDWRREVFLRDDYTCQQCGVRGNAYITAHHIKSWVKYPEYRFDVQNGLTLCDTCHALTDNYKAKAHL